MDYILPVTLLLTALMLIVPGILVKYYQAYWLIAGYNTMSAEKKKNVDVVGLSRFSGNICFIMAAIITLAGVLLMAGKTAIAGIIFALMVPVTIYTLIKAQTYDGNTRNPDGTMNNKTKLVVGAISFSLIVTLIGVGVLIYQSSKPSEYIITAEYLEIKGLYGEKINLKDVKEITLTESLPEIISRTNGAAVGNKMKGHFKLDKIGDVKLFVDINSPPFVIISRETKPVIINCDNEGETKEIFIALLAEWQKERNK